MSKVTLQAKVGSAMPQRRLSLGYSQDSFADAIGMHRAYYSAIERGERNVTLATLARVAKAWIVRSPSSWQRPASDETGKHSYPELHHGSDKCPQYDSE